MNMLLTEWNWDDAREAWKEEAETRVLELLKESGYDTSKLEEKLNQKEMRKET
jgi:hypothetical protein